MTSYIDTHAHYFISKFDNLEGGAAALLDSPDFRAAVRGVINVGISLESSRKAVEQAARYPFMVTAVGIHPEAAQGIPDGTPLDPDRALADLRAWVSDTEARRRDKIVAIGEMGLDYYWQPMDKALQKVFFEGQLALAAELDLPVIIHDREAHGDCFDTVCRYPSVRGVFHAYSGSAEMARDLVRRGWYIAFGGPVTYKNAERTRAAAAAVPMDRLLLETDCPYLTPVPHRGEVNHSGYIPYIAEVIADLHGVTVEEVAEITAKNAENLFKLSDFIG